MKNKSDPKLIGDKVLNYDEQRQYLLDLHDALGCPIAGYTNEELYNEIIEVAKSYYFDPDNNGKPDCGYWKEYSKQLETEISYLKSLMKK